MAVIPEPPGLALPLALEEEGSSGYDSAQREGAAMGNDCASRGDFDAWQPNFVTPTRKAKPAGVMGAETWVKIPPTPPVDPSELTFLAVDTRTPYTTDFDGADGGKEAHYMLPWVATRRETGPWSETATATARSHNRLGRRPLRQNRPPFVWTLIRTGNGHSACCADQSKHC